MKRLNLFLSGLLLFLTISALVIVYSKHQSRKLYIELVGLSLERDELNVEWGRLRLEQGSMANPSKIETAARNRLGMLYPDDIQILVRR